MLCILLFFNGTMLTAETGLNSKMQSDGSFFNRISWEHELFSLGFVSDFKDGKFVFIEPVLKSEYFIAGRLQLKGSVRELSSTGTPLPNAGVLSEQGTLSVSGTFTRPSRFGAAVIVPGASDAAIWFFRSNDGLLHTGALLNNLAIPDGILEQNMHIETDLLIIGGQSRPLEDASSWFSDSDRIPFQLQLNPASEIRIAFGEGRRPGRRLPAFTDESFNAVLSLLLCGSMPQYTEPSGRLRAYLKAGNKTINAAVIASAAAPGFLDASGTLSEQQYAFGASANLLVSRNEALISFSCSFMLETGTEPVIPSAYITRNEIVETGIEFSEGIFSTAADGSYKRSYSLTGVCSNDVSAKLKVDLSPDPFKISSAFRFKTGFEDYMPAETVYSFSIRTAFDSEFTGISSEYSFDGDEQFVKTGAVLKTERWRIKCLVDLSVSEFPPSLTDFRLEFTSK